VHDSILQCSAKLHNVWLIYDVAAVLLDKFTRFNIENELYETSSKGELKILWSYLCSAHQLSTD